MVVSSTEHQKNTHVIHSQQFSPIQLRDVFIHNLSQRFQVPVLKSTHSHASQSRRMHETCVFDMSDSVNIFGECSKVRIFAFVSKSITMPF